MARLIAALICFLLPVAAAAQSGPDRHFQEADVCGRCHVISVVEWSVSAHSTANTNCVSCHGASLGHVEDERNNIKPEGIPHGAAIAGLCMQCHSDGCAKSKRKDSCQSCHHIHALVNPDKPPATQDPRLEDLAARWTRFESLLKEGDQFIQTRKWEAARDVFRKALQEKPGSKDASEKLKMCERRLKPDLPGFEIGAGQLDAKTGLPREVRVAGIGIPMVLVPGGEFEMGSKRFQSSKTVHTVRVNTFYLAKYEFTQAAWKSLMGTNPSAHQGKNFQDSERLPVEQVSWQDCQTLVKTINARVPGGGFRLPTEAEWEYSASLGATPRRAVGLGRPAPVTDGQPNRLGLVGMLGNVWEWCSSLHKPYPYIATDGREDPSALGLRVLRGGSYADPAEWFDATARHDDRPGRRLQWYGVRLARSVPGEPER